MFLSYYKTNIRNTKVFIPVLVGTPGLTMFGSYYLEKQKLIRKVRLLGLP